MARDAAGGAAAAPLPRWVARTLRRRVRRAAAREPRRRPRRRAAARSTSCAARSRPTRTRRCRRAGGRWCCSPPAGSRCSRRGSWRSASSPSTCPWSPGSSRSTCPEPLGYAVALGMIALGAWMLVRGDRAARRLAHPPVALHPRRDVRSRTTMTLVPGDPLAHRALESLLRAEASVRRRLTADLEREGVSATGFSVLVVLTTAGGQLELRTLRARLQTSKANATEVVTTLESRGLVVRQRLERDRRAASVAVTDRGGSSSSGSSRSTPAGWRTRSRCSTRPRSARWRRSAASSPQSEPATPRYRPPPPCLDSSPSWRVACAAALSACGSDTGKPGAADTTDDTPAQTTPATTTPPETHAGRGARARGRRPGGGRGRRAPGSRCRGTSRSSPTAARSSPSGPGRVRLIDADGELQDEPVAEVDVFAEGEAGLMGIALDPEFEDGEELRLHGRRDRRGHPGAALGLEGRAHGARGDRARRHRAARATTLPARCASGPTATSTCRPATPGRRSARRIAPRARGRSCA